MRDRSVTDLTRTVKRVVPRPHGVSSFPGAVHRIDDVGGMACVFGFSSGVLRRRWYHAGLVMSSRREDAANASGRDHC
jgi:hypothetical protein